MSLETLSAIDGPILINELEPEQVKELQTGLALAGYPVGEMDGIIGPKQKMHGQNSRLMSFQEMPV
jgi:hypothetical protein